MNGTNQTMRDANGRFVPGMSGNPAGKKLGTRNRATVLREAFAEGEDIATARVVIDKALAGNLVAARFIVDRLTPRPRARAIALDLPDDDMVAAFDRTIAAMASGEITPDEAVMVSRVLDGKMKALKAMRRERQSSTHAKDPSPRHQEPSPACGRGQGEGSRSDLLLSSSRTSGSPHHNPLPQAGEGTRSVTQAPRSPADFHTSLLHSTCILHQSSLVPASLTGTARAA
jgi:hypothetical protein